MVDEEKTECQVIANKSIKIQCKINKDKHNSGYQCLDCSGEIDGKKIFESKKCVDAIHVEAPVNIDFPNIETLQIWKDITEDKEVPIEILGCYSDIYFKKVFEEIKK